MSLKSAFNGLENFIHVGYVAVTHEQIGQSITKAFEESAMFKTISAAVAQHISSLAAIEGDLQKAVALGGDLGLPAGSEAANLLAMANTALQAINSVQTILAPIVPANPVPAPVPAPAAAQIAAPAGSESSGSGSDSSGSSTLTAAD